MESIPKRATSFVIRDIAGLFLTLLENHRLEFKKMNRALLYLVFSYEAEVILACTLL